MPNMPITTQQAQEKAMIKATIKSLMLSSICGRVMTGLLVCRVKGAK